jgi:hypothetical protein
VPFFKLSASVFGGRFNRPLGIAFRLTGRANVTVSVRQRGRTLRTFRRRGVRRGRTVRLRMPSERVRRGDVRIVLRARAEGRTVTRTLVARRL